MRFLLSSEAAVVRSIFFRKCCVLLALTCLSGLFTSSPARGAIPAGERSILQNLYISTNGDSWTNKTNWNGPAGTECTWFGITCDTGNSHVTRIDLNSNLLSGTLSSVGGLVSLQALNAYNNQLTGSIPSLSELTNLQVVMLFGNQFTGLIPSLSGLKNLQIFYVFSNQLTGPIPSLSGLTSLRYFYANSNQLAGPIPSLAGLANLEIFEVSNNLLTGSIPALSGLTKLNTFVVSNNKLSGPIPSMSGLTSMDEFFVNGNQLSGSIPSLAGLTNLTRFIAEFNQLSGSIPPLSGLTKLEYVYLSYNQLTGSIPSLSGLGNLQLFLVSNNRLTGSIPSLSGLTNLTSFYVNQNYLSGDVPNVPNPNKLANGGSSLCPNDLNDITNSAWNTATGITPWYKYCTDGPIRFSVAYDGNGNTGGTLPDTVDIYATGSTVTVLGNTGALYRPGYSFKGWNSAANGSGTPYVGGDTFVLGSANITLYAQWTATSASPVRIFETGINYPDIHSAYDLCSNGNTIEVWDGLRGQNLVFDTVKSIKLRGGYNSTFTASTGATLVSGSITFQRGSVDFSHFIIQ